VTPFRHADAVEPDRGRSAERLVTFTDAVLAIAITLLALPLAELGPDLQNAGFAEFVQDKGFAVLGFAISFFVIARLWWSHHRIFAHVVRWDAALVRLTLVWLFTIVLIGPATALTTANDAAKHPDVVAAYMSVLVVSSALLTALAQHVLRHPELTDGRDAEARHRLVGSVTATIGFVLALVLGTLVPSINYFAIFVLVITGRIGDLLERRRQRRLNIR
jgi:uncharacterized membrane protein